MDVHSKSGGTLTSAAEIVDDGFQKTAWKATACATAAVFLLVSAWITPACGQTYPSKPIRILLPMNPGGVTDILGRIVCQKLGETLGQPFVPENRPGAGGNIGLELAARARPDGYTT
jgi:tripartite-type tricarboxylate transporter receptor subunit TctC